MSPLDPADDTRLKSIEASVDEIKQALLGSYSGHAGLIPRVERMEGILRWVLGIVTAIIIAGAVAFFKVIVR